jgi:hypothetical protein
LQRFLTSFFARPTEIVDAIDATAIFPQTTMEMTMQKIFFAVLFIPLAAELTAQTAASASEHHTRTKHRAVLSEQVRNSNAYAAPGDIALPAGAPDYDEGAMTSGLAGR